MKKTIIPYHPFDNFVLRTPLLPFDFYQELTAGQSVTEKAFKQAFSKEIIKEAVFLASPTLFFELEKWIKGDLETKKEEKVKFSFLKYLTRMSTRCTPFGLFAGCGLGNFTDNSSLVLSNIGKHNRHTRPDMNYLVALSQDLAKLNHIKTQLFYYPNSSVYSIGNQLRYIEYFYQESRRQHRIVQIDNSIYLQNILNRAAGGASLQQLANVLIDDTIGEEQAISFLDELLDSQVLVSDLEPSVSGSPFVSQILSVLHKLKDCQSEISFLTKIQSEYKALDLNLGNKAKMYLDLSDSIQVRPTGFELKYLFQTDLGLTTTNCELSNEHLKDLKRALVLFNRATKAQTETNLTTFKEAFFERYEGQEVSLCNVLDVETGIGYLQNIKSGDINPLIDDLILPIQEDPYHETNLTLNNFHRVLLNKMINTPNETIHLKESDFQHLPFYWHDLPDTISAMVELVQKDGSVKIAISSFTGSSAANLLGRFCHDKSPITDFTNNIVEKEKSMHPDKILAEIVHLPEARVGNVLMRPNFREFEIPYLAKSNVAIDKQIPLQDLLISIRNNKIFLRSKKHDKEVLPRLTNAHNYSSNALPIYQFLCDMQTQGMRNYIGFNFGPLNRMYDFLPRVEFGNLILHEAKWRINKNEIQYLLQIKPDEKKLLKAIQAFQNQKLLPDHVVLSDGDNELLINFKNITAIQMFLETIKNRDTFMLKEFLHVNNEMVIGEKGHFTNQVLISFFNQEKAGTNFKSETLHHATT